MKLSECTRAHLIELPSDPMDSAEGIDPDPAAVEELTINSAARTAQA